jgi:uncharacterized membrane protein
MPMPLFVKIIAQTGARPRLTTSTLIGCAAFLLLPVHAALSTRALLAWDIGVGLYLILAWTMMLRGTVGHMRARARKQDDGALAVLVLTLAAAIASLAAIILELAGIKSYPAAEHGRHFLLAGWTIVCSWFFIHTAFALHYAHDFYAALTRTKKAALDFPNQPEPTYWDFLYFSFVLGTTSQTSDVDITSTNMRRLALLHGVVAFFYNTTLLALTINIAAGWL